MPQLDDLSQVLQRHTGFRIRPVAGLVRGAGGASLLHAPPTKPQGHHGGASPRGPASASVGNCIVWVAHASATLRPRPSDCPQLHPRDFLNGLAFRTFHSTQVLKCLCACSAVLGCCCSCLW